MGQKKNVNMSMTEEEVKVVEAPTENEVEEKTASKKTIQKKTRSQKYQAVRSQVDKTRRYDPFSAIELVKRLSYSQFPGTMTAHLVLANKFQNEQVQFEFPHETGKSLQVAIANEATLKKIEAGKIEFDVLLAAPEMMSKITKFAPVLGPQGLMPNPKQGTLTADPEAKKKEIESGKLTLKTEHKAPLLHVVIGDTEMKTEQLQANLQTLLDAFDNKLKRVTLAATMSPGVKIKFEE